MAQPSGRHSLTRNSQPKEKRWSSFLFLLLVLLIVCCVVSIYNFMLYWHLCITDDKPAKLWAGGVCPWRPGQSRVQSDLHLVGGEDQPVAGSEGAVTLLTATQTTAKTPPSCYGAFVVVFIIDCMLCTLYVLQDELSHSSKGSSVIGLLDIYGFEVLQHNR